MFYTYLFQAVWRWLRPLRASILTLSLRRHWIESLDALSYIQKMYVYSK